MALAHCLGYIYESQIPLIQLAKAKASERQSTFGDNHILSFYCSDLVLAGQGGGSCSHRTGTLVRDFKVDAIGIHKGGRKSSTEEQPRQTASAEVEARKKRLGTSSSASKSSE